MSLKTRGGGGRLSETQYRLHNTGYLTGPSAALPELMCKVLSAAAAAAAAVLARPRLYKRCLILNE